MTYGKYKFENYIIFTNINPYLGSGVLEGSSSSIICEGVGGGGTSTNMG